MAQRLVVERCLQRCSGWRDLNFWKFGEEGLNFDRFPLDKFKPCAGRFEKTGSLSLQRVPKNIFKDHQSMSKRIPFHLELFEKFRRNSEENREEIQNISVLDVFSSRLVQQVSWLFDSSYCWPRRLLFRSRCGRLRSCSEGSRLTAWFFLKSRRLSEKRCHRWAMLHSYTLKTRCSKKGRNPRM